MRNKKNCIGSVKAAGFQRCAFVMSFPDMDSRLKRERKTVEAMIKLYCREAHGAGETLCAECSHLMEYVTERLEQCPFGGKKPVCFRCNIHCYESQMRQRIRSVMRTAGRKMIYRHPVMLIRHVMDLMKKGASQSNGKRP